MKCLSLIVSIILLGTLLQGQGLFVDQKNVSYFTIDALHNVYTLSGNQLTKYNKQGDVIQQYSHSIYGQISAIDVSDPLRLMLFFQESNTLLYLTQQLALIGDPIELTQLSDVEAKWACTSNQGGFWIYDELSQTIIYFDNNRIQRFQSQNIALLGNNTNPISIQEQNNNIYLSFEDNYTMVFDQFATYETQIPQSIKSDMIIGKHYIRFWNGATWVSYDTRLKEFDEQSFPTIKSELSMPFGTTLWIHLIEQQLYKTTP